MISNHSQETTRVVFTPARHNNSSSVQTDVLTSILNDIQVLKEQNAALKQEVASLRETLKTHLTECSTNKATAEMPSSAKAQKDNTTSLLTTFLNSYEAQSNGPVFFDCEIKDFCKIQEQVNKFMEQPDRAAFRQSSLEKDTVWRRRLQYLIGAHRNRFAYNFRDQVLRCLRIDRKLLPWSDDDEQVDTGADTTKKKGKKRTQEEIQAEEEQKQQQLRITAERRQTFKQVFNRALDQYHWSVSTLTLHVLDMMQKTTEQHVAFAFVVMGQFQKGEQLERESSIKPAGQNTYLSYLLDVRSNRIPMDGSITLEEALTKARS